MKDDSGKRIILIGFSMNFANGLALWGCLLGFLGIAAVGSQNLEPQSQPDVPAVNLRSTVDLVLADALVLDQHGKTVSGLRIDDFQVFDNGIRQQVSYCSQDVLPLSVLLLVDRGGCLDPYTETVRTAILEILKTLKNHDQVAIMAFSDRTTRVLDFTRDETLVSAALGRMPKHESFGGHCFNYALSDAANYLRERAAADSRRVVVVITAQSSGLCNSGPSPGEVTRRLLEAGAVVYGIIPRTRAQQLESGAYRAGTALRRALRIGSVVSLTDMARETGGEIFNEPPAMLAASFAKLTGHLRTRYTLGFTPSNPTRDGAFHRLKIGISPETSARLGPLRIRARRGYAGSREPTGP